MFAWIQASLKSLWASWKALGSSAAPRTLSPVIEMNDSAEDASQEDIQPTTRSAAEAFGSSEALQASPGTEANDSAEDASQVDIHPTTMLISKIQAVELLDKLIQFVPKEYSKGSAVAEADASAAKNSEIGDIRILSQFKLRYLCRRFRNMIHMQTPLTLGCSIVDDDGNYGVKLVENGGLRVSRDRPLNRLAELPKHFDSASEFCATCKETFDRKTVLLIDSISTWSLELGFPGERSLSIAALLYRLAETAQMPCRMSLNLTVDNYTVQAIVKDFDVPLKRQFPSVALTELKFDLLFPDDASAVTASRLLMHLLEFGQHSLVMLDVNVYLLKSAFTNSVRDSYLPAAWTCDTLQTLKLDLEPYDGDYDFDNDEDGRAELLLFCASLPRHFPNLKKIEFKGQNPHVDFNILNDFERLVAVKLGALYPTAEQCRSLSRLNSTNVSSLSCIATDLLLRDFRIQLPKLSWFRYVVGTSSDAFDTLRHQLDAANGSFENLRELVLKLDNKFKIPSYLDFMSLLLSLRRLSNLTSLRLQFEYFGSDYHAWCKPGDFSIIQLLPETITNARFVFALRPAAVDYDDEMVQYSLSCNEIVPFAAETIYTHWLRALLVHTSERLRLDRFFCVAVAPRFEAILALAEKWNKSSAAAIADLALTFLLHVQCTPVYARMLEAGIPARVDGMRFHFVLAPREILASGPAAVSAKLNRRMVTVEFENRA